MRTRVLERDGIMRLTRFSHADEHEGHETYWIDRVCDNPVEYVVWHQCEDCDEGFIYEARELRYVE